MSASFKVDLSAIKRLEKRFDDPAVKIAIMQIPQKKAVAALVAEAIADNFAEQGPGWKPLKAQTIRSSVSKKLKKKLSDMTNKELLAHEAKAGGTPHRQILKKTGTLMKSVTTPGAQHNVNKVEGTTLVWGTDLAYASIHNKGGVIHHPGTKRGFGIEGLKIPAHDIPIPKREFLVIRERWWNQLNEYIADQTTKIIAAAIKKGD